MPKKKKGGGKKKKKDDGPAAPSAGASSFQPLVLIPVTEQWVTLELKLLNWNYMNFHHRCKTDTRLFQIKNLLQEKHGRTQNLKICKEAFAERNEMVDDMATLEAEGIQGAAQEAPQVVRRAARVRTRLATCSHSRLRCADSYQSLFFCPYDCPAQMYTLYYDFTPCDSDDPLLVSLAQPALFLPMTPPPSPRLSL